MADRKPLTKEQKAAKAEKDKARRVAANKGQAAKDHAARSKRGAKGTKAVKRPPPDTKDAVAKRKLIGPGDLKELMDNVRHKSSEQKKFQGQAGALIANAVTEKNLNAKAFRVCQRMINDAVKDKFAFTIFLQDLDYYMKTLKVRAMAEKSLFPPGVGRHADGEGDEEHEAPEDAGETAGDEAEDETGDNVHQLKPAAA